MAKTVGVKMVATWKIKGNYVKTALKALLLNLFINDMF